MPDLYSLFLAVSLTSEQWIRIGVVLAGLVLLALAVRWIFHLNRIVVLVVVLLGGGLMITNWIYHQTEPTFLTPFFDVLRLWLPSKDTVISL